MCQRRGIGVRVRSLFGSRLYAPAMLTVGLALRIVWVALFHAEPVSDASWYFRSAQGIAEGLGYQSRGQPSVMFPVGYPAFLAVLFRLFGASPLVGLAGNVLLDLGVLLLSYLLALRLFGSRVVAGLTLALLCLLPSQLVYVGLLFSEIWFVFLMLLGFRILLGEPSPPLLVVAGCALGLAYLTKPQFLLVPPLLIALQMWQARRDGHPMRPPLLRGLAVLTVALLLTSGWTLRNYRHFGRFIPVSANTGVNLFIGNNAASTGGFVNPLKLVEKLPASAAQELLRAPSDAASRSVVLGRIARRFIRDQPTEFVRRIPGKLQRLFRSDANAFRLVARSPGLPRQRLHWLAAAIPVAAAYYGSLLALGGAGVLLVAWRVARGRAEIPSLIGLGLILYLMAVHSVFFATSRFHFPMLPWLSMYAAVILARLLGDPPLAPTGPPGDPSG